MHTSNPSTPLSPMTSPLAEGISPAQQTDDNKRKRDDDDVDDIIKQEIEQLLNSLIESIHNEITLSSDKTVKRQKT
jgi:hypothetical protein